MNSWSVEPKSIVEVKIIMPPGFQSEHPENVPGLAELGVQGVHQTDGIDQEDADQGCSLPMGEHAPHSLVQISEHGSRLQSSDGGPLNKQVGA